MNLKSHLIESFLFLFREPTSVIVYGVRRYNTTSLDDTDLIQDAMNSGANKIGLSHGNLIVSRVLNFPKNTKLVGSSTLSIN